jgi:hypothetical protein
MKQVIDKILFGARMLLGFNLISLKHIINITPRCFLYAYADAFSAAKFYVIRIRANPRN